MKVRSRLGKGWGDGDHLEHGRCKPSARPRAGSACSRSSDPVERAAAAVLQAESSTHSAGVTACPLRHPVHCSDHHFDNSSAPAPLEFTLG